MKAQGKKKGSGQCTLTLTQQEKGTASFVENDSKKRPPVFPKGYNSPSTVTSTEFLQIPRFHYQIIDQGVFFIVRVSIATLHYCCHFGYVVYSSRVRSGNATPFLSFAYYLRGALFLFRLQILESCRSETQIHHKCDSFDRIIVLVTSHQENSSTTVRCTYT